MQRRPPFLIGDIRIRSLLQQSVNAEIGAFLGGPVQRRPSLWIGGIDRILNPLRLLRVCSETLTAVIGSGFLLVFPAPSDRRPRS